MYAGLKIAPVIPAAWDGFTVTRRYRGSTLRIVVHNPMHVCRGVTRMSVDRRNLEGDVIPQTLPEGEHDVEVWLGR